MTGLLLIPVAVVWLLLALAATGWIARCFKTRAMKVASCVVAFPLLMAAPLADELVGKHQFEQLCKDNSTIQVNRATAIGKTVYFVPQPGVEIKGTWVRVVMRPQRFVDAKTDETVVSYNEFIAAGGWLIRSLGISEGGMPLVFRGSCELSENPSVLFKSLEITALDRPKQNIKGD